MPVVIAEKANSILSAGIWLEPYLHAWALTKEQALAAIRDLRDANYIILGGDVLHGPDNNYKHTYDNWYFEPSNPPCAGDVISGAVKAIDYVRAYPRDHVYFVLVPTKSLIPPCPS